MQVLGEGTPDAVLTESAIDAIVAQGLDSLPLAGQRVLVIIPDGTRTMPVPLYFRLLTRHLLPRARAVDFLVALGTHPPLDEAALLRLVGITPEARRTTYARVGLFNHAWNDPAALIALGTLDEAEVAAVSEGLLREAVPVRLNRRILDYDHLLICGPVFPHEVAGFSGGNKYFFPGIAGSDIIDLSHWLGALLTSYHIIGTRDTPVRRLIDRAAALIPRPRHAFCSVVTDAGVAGLFFGTPEAAFASAADLSARVHVRRVPRPYARVLSVLPPMYQELWVGAKGMYKLEPVVADGGELILYAPHLREISLAHGTVIRQVGYHVRDYFVKQWDRFKHLPWKVLAHATHLRGVGTFEDGVERPRIRVTLATGLPEALCHEIGLGYCDPARLDPAAWAAAGDGDRLMVPRAGEILYRLG